MLASTGMMHTYHITINTRVNVCANTLRVDVDALQRKQRHRLSQNSLVDIVLYYYPTKCCKYHIAHQMHQTMVDPMKDQNSTIKSGTSYMINEGGAPVSMVCASTSLVHGWLTIGRSCLVHVDKWKYIPTSPTGDPLLIRFVSSVPLQMYSFPIIYSSLQCMIMD